MEVQLWISSCPDRASGERIAQALLEQQLAACVSLLPGAVSLYRWQGQIERSEEVLLLIKTVRACGPRLIAAWPALHPYELPELIAVDVVSGLPAYLQWVVDHACPLSPGPAPEQAC